MLPRKLRVLLIMPRRKRIATVLFIVWIIGFSVFIYTNETASFFSKSTRREEATNIHVHNKTSAPYANIDEYTGSLAGQAIKRTGDVGHPDVHIDVGKENDAILKRIVASDTGNFTYVSSDNVGIYDSSRGRFTDVDDYLKNKEYGFFVEVGTEGNEPASLTFLLERSRGWTGLVIEPHSEPFQELMQMKRNSKFLKACLQTTVGVWPAFDDGNVSRDLPCFRLDDILKTLKRDRIDLLVFDATEYAIPSLLETFPFKYINVALICIELHGTNVYVRPLVEKFRKKDFQIVKLMTNHVYRRTDLLLVNNNLKF